MYSLMTLRFLRQVKPPCTDLPRVVPDLPTLEAVARPHRRQICQGIKILARRRWRHYWFRCCKHATNKNARDVSMYQKLQNVSCSVGSLAKESRKCLNGNQLAKFEYLGPILSQQGYMRLRLWSLLMGRLGGGVKAAFLWKVKSWDLMYRFRKLGSCFPFSHSDCGTNAAECTLRL